MARKWTEEERRRQAELIRRHKPWEKSTGPKTAQGKARSSLNAIKHGAYMPHWALLRQGFRLNTLFLRHVDAFYRSQDYVDGLRAVKARNELRRNAQERSDKE